MDSIANILIFDSGVGGLSVYQEIYTLLPNQNYIYLFDNEAYPYGELAEDVLRFRATNLIESMVNEKEIDLVVVACNTASTVILPTLRSRLTIPVVGVVPAIKPACHIAKQAVGLLATPATISRRYTQELINAFSLQKEVQRLGSTDLVNMAEDKLRGHEICRTQLEQILAPFVGQVDVVVLGCTHFPLLKAEIQSVMGEHVTLIDSGKAIAKRVELLLSQCGIKRREKRDNTAYCSAAPKDETALYEQLKQLGFIELNRHSLVCL